MPTGRIFLLTALAMLAFAGNSLLCRLALGGTSIDAASFTGTRLISGALMLYLITRIRNGRHIVQGNWLSALALFAYAAGFSYAYISLPAATGALLLFSAVQITMIAYGIRTGEHLLMQQWLGLLLAFIGLIALLLPGLSAPPLLGTVYMVGAGIAWGIYSLRGKTAGDPLKINAGNFLRAVPFALALSLSMAGQASIDSQGMLLAICSGALTSGIGYAIWYAVLPDLKAASAAAVQLSVPIIAAIGGALFLAEAISLRLIFSAVAILGGIALVIFRNHHRRSLRSIPDAEDQTD